MTPHGILRTRCDAATDGMPHGILRARTRGGTVQVAMERGVAALTSAVLAALLGLVDRD